MLCVNVYMRVCVRTGPLDRHVAGVFSPLQQAVELLGISIDPEVQLKVFRACVQGATAAEDWHMRLAAVQAIGQMAQAVQVCDLCSFCASLNHLAPQRSGCYKLQPIPCAPIQHLNYAADPIT